MKTSTTVPVDTKRAQLREWYRKALGRWVSQAERSQLDALLPSLAGKCIVQLGYLGEFNLLISSQIPHHIILDHELDLKEVDIHAYAAALPFDSESIDVLVLPHTLELESIPNEVLGEVNRVLAPEGHLIIIGFNPFGLWGLWRLLGISRREPPWCDNFLKLSQIYDVLSSLDFKVFHTRYFFFRPPFHCAFIMRILSFLEVLDGCGWFPLGSLYLMVAQKQIAAMTPIRLRWEEIRPTASDLCWAEPTAPEVSHGR